MIVAITVNITMYVNEERLLEEELDIETLLCRDDLMKVLTANMIMTDCDTKELFYEGDIIEIVGNRMEELNTIFKGEIEGA